MKRALLLLTLLVAALPQSAGAQSGARLILRSLQTESFPIMTGYLDARDGAGAPIPDLQAQDLSAMEDGITSPIELLRSTDVGLRVILVINPTESFAIRNSEGATRFEIVKQSIIEWAGLLSSTSDTTLSLVTPSGVEVADTQAAEWLPTLESYELTLGIPEVNTQTMTEALELANRQTTEPGVSAAIWWVTATPRMEALASVDRWQEQLSQTGARLFIWQIDSPSTFTSEAAQALQVLAEASGGEILSFSGAETIPQPEDYFAPLRSAYFFQYTSALHTPGGHEVSLQMQREGGSVVSPPALFDLNIEPPSPILVSPPSQIERAPSETDPQQLAPFNQPIEIVVEFPDGFQRNLNRTTLYVNGEPVAENRTNPFTRFAWDLTAYEDAQQVFLRVEAEDELGLVGSTVEFPVEIIVQNPPGWIQGVLARSAPVFALSIVLISAGAFFLIMVLSGRLDPARFTKRRGARLAPVETITVDPLVDSPLPINKAQFEEYLPDRNAIRKPGPSSVMQNPPLAYLQALGIQDQSRPTPIHPLHGDHLIGAEKSVDLVLEDASVDPQHARVSADAEGTFRIADLGSSAGTWVNYAPVSRQGAELHNGDLIHIGRVAFRFLQESENNLAPE